MASDNIHLQKLALYSLPYYAAVPTISQSMRKYSYFCQEKRETSICTLCVREALFHMGTGMVFSGQEKDTCTRSPQSDTPWLGVRTGVFDWFVPYKSLGPQSHPGCNPMLAVQLMLELRALIQHWCYWVKGSTVVLCCSCSAGPRAVLDGGVTGGTGWAGRCADSGMGAELGRGH